MGEPIRARVTWTEYQQLPEDGKRYEVVEGELMMSLAPGFRHQRASGNLYYVVDSWRRVHAPGGQVLAAPFDVILSEDTILQPDLIYVCPERAGLIVDERLRGSPDLAVEIFHTAGAARDRVSKLQVYARFKVPEYWLVDLDARTVTMLGLAVAGYEVFASGSGDTRLVSRGLPGLAILPREVFEGI